MPLILCGSSCGAPIHSAQRLPGPRWPQDGLAAGFARAPLISTSDSRGMVQDPHGCLKELASTLQALKPVRAKSLMDSDLSKNRDVPEQFL